jgi:CBS domain-containing protein
MKARDVMNKRVTAATPRAIGRDLAQQLLSGMYSGLPVVDTHGAVIGVVTEFDLLNALREGKDLQTVKAEEIMGQPAVCVEEEDPITGYERRRLGAGRLSALALSACETECLPHPIVDAPIAVLTRLRGTRSLPHTSGFSSPGQ